MIAWMITPHYRSLVQPLAALITQTGQPMFFDLASGNGGPWVNIQPALLATHSQAAEITLSDLYPPADTNVSNQRLTWYQQPVDMTQALPDLQGAVVTVFNSFHHLNPRQARQLLSEISRQRCSMLIVEITRRERRWIPLTLLGIWFTVPRIFQDHRDVMYGWRLARFFAILPVLLLMVSWDCVVSLLRTYRTEEVRAMLPSDSGYRCREIDTGSMLQAVWISNHGNTPA